MQVVHGLVDCAKTGKSMMSLPGYCYANNTSKERAGARGGCRPSRSPALGETAHLHYVRKRALASRRPERFQDRPPVSLAVWQPTIPSLFVSRRACRVLLTTNESAVRRITDLWIELETLDPDDGGNALLALSQPDESHSVEDRDAARALSVLERVLGPNHADALVSRCILEAAAQAATTAQPRRREGHSPSAAHSIGTNQQVRRNDPCPCGSGKKFKKCCWGVDR
jgi:hypothetical protein